MVLKILGVLYLPAEFFDALQGRTTWTRKAERVDVEIVLRAYLAGPRMDRVAFSVLKHLATYGIGRTLTYNELVFLEEKGLTLRRNGYRMQDMVRFVITSDIFLTK